MGYNAAMVGEAPKDNDQAGDDASGGKRFRIAFSFAGEKRDFVVEVAGLLADEFGKERILYDKYHEAEFARARLGRYLPKLYRDEAELVVVVICKDYVNKEWTGLEWDAIFDLIKKRQDSEVMLCRFDRAEIDGLYSDAGFVELEDKTPKELATLILKRLELNASAQTKKKGKEASSSQIQTTALAASGKDSIARTTEATILGPRVFISFTWKTKGLDKRMLKFADFLRSNGVDSRIDVYHSGGHHGFSRPEGWYPSWYEEQIRDARLVLVVCTKEYVESPSEHVLAEQAYMAKEIDSGTASRRKFVPVGFGPYHEQSKYIPSFIDRHADYYDLTSDGRKGDLVRQLKQERMSAGTSVPLAGGFTSAAMLPRAGSNPSAFFFGCPIARDADFIGRGAE
jgi:hypothetical protein